jgi:hypothetical protein
VARQPDLYRIPARICEFEGTIEGNVFIRLSAIERLVVQPLVRLMLAVEVDARGDQVVEVLFAEHHEMSQATRQTLRLVS